MKHGIAFRKFSRTSSHRMLMLRNLVTSLFEHEQIKTTLPKARDTARLAEKIITLGKRGDRAAFARASSFLLQSSLVSKLFETFATRYANRPGGYTRIHKFGNRKGDNAPQAVLELVDHPRDIRWEMTSRAVGWELLRDKLKSQRAERIINSGANDAHQVIERERNLPFGSKGLLRPTTRWNLQKVLKYRGKGSTSELSKKVGEHFDQLLATPLAFRRIQEERKEGKVSKEAHEICVPVPSAGRKYPGETRPALSLARGALGHQMPLPQGRVLQPKSVSARRYKGV